MKPMPFFLKEAEKVQSTPDEDELNLIWHSAVNFGKRAASQKGITFPRRLWWWRTSVKARGFLRWAKLLFFPMNIKKFLGTPRY